MRCSSRWGVCIHCFCLKQPSEFTKDDAELLFGPDADYKAAFEELDTDEDGEVRLIRKLDLQFTECSKTFTVYLMAECFLFQIDR